LGALSSYSGVFEGRYTKKVFDIFIGNENFYNDEESLNRIF
jgi:hypothetical protein